MLEIKQDFGIENHQIKDRFLLRLNL